MYFRSQKKTAQDISLSEYIETGKDGNALSLMEVVSSEEDLFDDLSGREMCGKLHKAMKDCLDAGNQAMLFINRRGYSTFVSCRECGKAVKCRPASVSEDQ